MFASNLQCMTQKHIKSNADVVSSGILVNATQKLSTKTINHNQSYQSSFVVTAK